jgi:hypothetical protein
MRGLGFGVPERRVILLAGLVAMLAALALPSLAAAQGQGKSILMYTGTTGYRHADGIQGAVDVLGPKLRALGYTVDREDCVDNGGGANNCDNPEKNPRIFSDANLAKYDAVVFANMSWKWAGGNKPGPLLREGEQNAIIKYVQNGGGIAAIHNATDAGAAQSVWDWWDGGPNSMVGSTMPGHSANNISATVQTIDPNHLSTKELPATWQISDEHYNFLRNVRGTHHVLATFDERTYNPGPNAKGQDHPITWCKLYDGKGLNDGTTTARDYVDGRTWVTGMGHNGVRYTENGGEGPMVKMMMGGIRWVAGEGKKTDCSGTVWSSFRRTVLVADANQPIGIDIAKDGKVYWSEAGLAGTAANNYESQGSIMMHDQKGAPGNKTVVAPILTRADHGNSEDGVLGFTLQPGFDLADPNKRHVFAYYSPRPGAGDNWPKGLDSPPRQVVGYNQISRWTLTADGKSVEPNSERVILRVPKAKIGGTTSTATPPVPGQGAPSGFPGGPVDAGPGHVGGAGLDFDSEGNLYLGVGDDVSPNAPGHSGYIPMDYRSAERWDARKTSANTADLRGKVLRITPSLGTLASDAPPGRGSTYSVPAGNLFPVGMEKTRPEIYAMGFRQPFTLHTDAKNPGLIGVGEYCHDASSDRAQRAPAGTCEWNLVGKASNQGWPFCVGDNSPANTAWRWNYANQTATGQQYDCSQEQIPSDINWAPEGQTAAAPTFQGLDMIPRPEKATVWKKYPNAGNQGVQSAADFGDLTTGGMQPIAGPIFRYNAATAGPGGFPAYYDGSWLINNRGTDDGWWKEVRIRSDNNQMLRVHDWLPYNHAGSALAQQNSRVIGTQFGEDGALYMSRYPVGCCRNQTNAGSQVQIVKVSFDVYEETNAPTVTAEMDPATPGDGRTYTGPVTLKFAATDPANTNPDQVQAGVDNIEYRVTLNGVPGPWVKSASNPTLVNQITSSVTVTDLGAYKIEYRASDRGGNLADTKSVTFWINRPTTATGTVKATVTSRLGLELNATGAVLGPFIPGVAQAYTGTATATVTSSWPNATLTVSDADTAAATSGRMTNGASVITQRLEVQNATGAFQTLEAPRVVQTWTAPVASAAATITFRQQITAAQVLVAGEYAKTLTYSLSTTTP